MRSILGAIAFGLALAGSPSAAVSDETAPRSVLVRQAWFEPVPGPDPGLVVYADVEVSGLAGAEVSASLSLSIGGRPVLAAPGTPAGFVGDGGAIAPRWTGRVPTAPDPSTARLHLAVPHRFLSPPAGAKGRLQGRFELRAGGLHAWLDCAAPDADRPPPALRLDGLAWWTGVRVAPPGPPGPDVGGMGEDLRRPAGPAGETGAVLVLDLHASGAEGADLTAGVLLRTPGGGWIMAAEGVEAVYRDTTQVPGRFFTKRTERIETDPAHRPDFAISFPDRALDRSPASDGRAILTVYAGCGGLTLRTEREVRLGPPSHDPPPSEEPDRPQPPTLLPAAPGAGRPAAPREAGGPLPQAGETAPPASPASSGRHGAALISAAAAGDAGEVARLIADGADLTAADAGGRTALHAAVAAGRTEVTTILLDAALGAVQEGVAPSFDRYLAGREGLLERADASGYTPLHVAAARGRTAVAALLLERSADAGAVDREGRTPCHLAAIAGHRAIVDLLADRGAPLKAQDLEGDRPEDLAATPELATAIREAALVLGQDPEARVRAVVLGFIGAWRAGDRARIARFLTDEEAAKVPADGLSPLPGEPRVESLRVGVGEARAELLLALPPRGGVAATLRLDVTLVDSDRSGRWRVARIAIETDP